MQLKIMEGEDIHLIGIPQVIDIPNGYELVIDGKPVNATTVSIRKKWRIEEAKNGDLIMAEGRENDFAFIFNRLLPIQEDYLNLESMPSVAYYIMCEFGEAGGIIANGKLTPKNLEGYSLRIATEKEKLQFFERLKIA